MPTVTINPGSGGDLFSNNATYATARAGSSVAATTGATARIGQIPGAPNYGLYEGFVVFDTSDAATGIPAVATITGAVLACQANALDAAQAFTLQARPYQSGKGPWGPTLAAADWVPGATLSTFLAAAAATIGSGSLSTSALNAWTDAGLLALINRAGNTELVFVSDRFVAGTAPVTNHEEVTIQVFNMELRLTYTVPPAVLVGSSAGVATAGASTLTLLRPIAATTAGAATGSGALTVLRPVAGSTAGAATVAANLSTIIPGLGGAAAGAATVAGALMAVAGLAGAAAGSATVAGAILKPAILAGSIGTTSTVTGTLRTISSLVGSTVAPAATVTGTLTMPTPGVFTVGIQFRGFWHGFAGLLTAGAWHAIECDTFGLNWTAGAGDYRGLFTTSDPGEATIYLYDKNRDYDPFNPSGAYAGEINMGGQLQIALDGITLFDGRINGIEHTFDPEPLPGLGVMPKAKLAAQDPQAKLSQIDLTGTILPSEATAARVGRLLDLGAYTGTRDIEAGGILLNATQLDGDLWSALVDVMVAEWGVIEWMPGGGVRTRNRGTVWPASPPATTLQIGCHSGAIPAISATSRVLRDTVRNFIRASNYQSATIVDMSDTNSSDDFGLRAVTRLDLPFLTEPVRATWQSFFLDRMNKPLQAWSVETRPRHTADVLALQNAHIMTTWCRLTINDQGPDLDVNLRYLGQEWSIDDTGLTTCTVTLGSELTLAAAP